MFRLGNSRDTLGLSDRDTSSHLPTMIVYVIHQEFVHFSDNRVPAVRQHCANNGVNPGFPPVDSIRDVRTWNIHNVYTSIALARETPRALCRVYAGAQGYSGAGVVALTYWGITADGRNGVVNAVVEKELI